MAITFIRYNESSKYYEYDTSAGKDGSGPWLILPIDASQIVQGVLNTGSGIKFPAVQNADANANTLDDYEEGDWTPIDTSGDALGLTITEAEYIKFGQLVVAWAALAYPSTASATLSKLGGLPFTSDASQACSIAMGYNDGATPTTMYIPANDTNILIYPNPGVTRKTNANLSTVTLIFSASYRAVA